MKYRFAFLIFIMFLAAPRAEAQGTSAYPGNSYWAAMIPFLDGEYGDAAKAFKTASGLKIGTDRWIDSICSSTMLGESYYQMGNHAAALEQYNYAVQLYIQYPNWLERVTNVPVPGQNPMRNAPPWGETKNGRLLAKLPEKVSIMFGFLDNSDPRQHGGVVAPPTLHSLYAGEIMRCTALAIRRRTELLGPLAEGDDLNAKMLGVLGRQRQAMMGNWMQAWVDIQTGLTLLSAGRDKEGTDALRRGTLIGGGEHPLTAVVYVEMGKHKLRAADYQAATQLYLEAATLGFYFEDLSIMEEALRGLADAYYLMDKPQLCPPAVAAEAWAKQKRYPVLRTSMLLALADELLKKNQTKQAAMYIAEAEKVMARRSMRNGKIGAQYHFLRARAGFRDMSPASQNSAKQAISAAVQFMQNGGSVWNFQLTMIDMMLLSGNLTPRKANDFYEKLLHEPTANDWAVNPLESLAFMQTPQPISWENWFWATFELGKKERALEIADMARRARFLQALPYGGRLHALRMLLEMPEAELTIPQRQRRADILADYKVYDVRAKEVAALKRNLTRMSLPPTDRENTREVTEMLDKIASLSAQQEAILSAMVLDRRQIDILFPPVKSVADVQKSLPRGGAMLAFYAARQQLYVFLLNKERFASWVIRDRGASKTARDMKENDLTSLQTNLSAMLREIGMIGAATPIKAGKMKEDGWKKHALAVMADLTKGSQADFSRTDFSSLTVVPDNFTWYMPFEMLQIQTPKGMRPTISEFEVNYAPMVSLGVPWKKSPAAETAGYTAVAQGKLESPTRETLEKLNHSVDNIVEFDAKTFGGLAVKASSSVSSVYGKCFDRLAVFDDMKCNPAAPFTLAPMSLDAGKAGATLADWMSLPWGAPRVVMLMGFHSRGESQGTLTKPAAASKNPSLIQTPPGQELFLTSMGFLAVGCDTVVLSRWRFSGDSAFLLTEGFLSRLDKTGDASEAWRYAVRKLASTTVSLKAESRVNVSSSDEDLTKGTHPALWAGYMLIDTGVLRGKQIAPADRAAAGEHPEKPQDDVPPPAAERPQAQPPKVPVVPPIVMPRG